MQHPDDVAPFAAPSGVATEPPAQRLPAPPTPVTRATRVIAVLLSLAIPFGGHVWLGRWRRGACFLAAGHLCLWATPWLGSYGLLLWLSSFLAPALDVLWLRPATQPSWGRRVALWAASYAALIVLGLLTRQLYMEAFKIPSGAMIPTFEIGDHIFINKLAKPGLGDVVVFPYPENPRQDFVKRIVAMPGDSFELRHNQIILNGAPQPRVRQGGACQFTDWDHETREWLRDQPCVRYDEAIGGHDFVTQDLPQPLETVRRDFGPIKVPDGQVYVMGDNRDNSHDSRYWGGVPIASIRGVVFLIWWSSGPSGVRWGRVGQEIH